MKALTFWKAVTVDREEFLERFLDVLRTGGVQYCLIDGQAVNAYAHRINVSAPDSDVRVQIQEVSPDLRGRVPLEILARLVG